MDGRAQHPDRGWWTDDRVSELKTRWLNQESASDIQHAMHAPSRSSVVGKAWRLGLAGTKANSPSKRRKNGQTIVPKAPKPVYIAAPHIIGLPPMPQELPPLKNPKRFIVLTDAECHWPGDGQPGPDLLCCAEAVVDGRPYCLAHCRIAYVRSNPRPLS